MRGEGEGAERIRAVPVVRMVRVGAFAAAALAVAAGARGAAEDGPKWDWGSGDSGPNGWAANFPDCGGKSQSPIDIVPELTSDPANLTVLGDMVNYSDEASFDVSQAYGSPKFSCSEAGTCGSVAAPDGTTYEVLQFHFHAPSENTINGMAYPLEMHIVHQNENGDLGVIGVLFTTEDVPDSDEAVAPLWKKVDATEGTIKANLNNFVNPESGFFSWQGSLTTPPCTEGLQWVLQKETVPISPAARNAFWNYIGGFPGSARPTMPLNGRIVTANGFPTPASRG